MNYIDDEECDSCGDVILQPSPIYDTHHYTFDLPAKNGHHWVTREFSLCRECIRKIVDWIDDCDESQVRADAVDLERLAEGLAEESARLKTAARRMEELARGEGGDDDARSG